MSIVCSCSSPPMPDKSYGWPAYAASETRKSCMRKSCMRTSASHVRMRGMSSLNHTNGKAQEAMEGRRKRKHKGEKRATNRHAEGRPSDGVDDITQSSDMSWNHGQFCRTRFPCKLWQARFPTAWQYAKPLPAPRFSTKTRCGGALLQDLRKTPWARLTTPIRRHQQFQT